MSEEDEEQIGDHLSESDRLYEEVSVEEPALEGEGYQDVKASRKSLTEQVEETPNLSDMQTAIIKLNPDDLGDDITNKVMVARIAPDAFLPLLIMMTKEDIANSDPAMSISVPSLLLKNYVLLSIGTDGKGRIDILELAGAAKELEEGKSAMSQFLR